MLSVCLVGNYHISYVLKQLGQISLPRLEKINTSMSWESSLFYNDEQWANPKLIILHKLITRCIFKKFLTYRSFTWTRTSRYKKFFYSPKASVYKSFKFKDRYLDYANNQRLLGNYIYHFNNKYIGLIIYISNKNGQNFYKKVKVLKGSKKI